LNILDVNNSGQQIEILVAKVRERLTVNKQGSHSFGKVQAQEAN
jgi:hypothetical protein